MFKYSEIFASLSVDNIEQAEEFYKDQLGLSVKKDPMGFLELEIPGSNALILYPKPDHAPAVFTVMNIPVDNIDTAVDYLIGKGIHFERYEGEIATDEKGICRSQGRGPNIAWFKDPAGNILSVLQE